jgi:prevent-host-death family protein
MTKRLNALKVRQNLGQILNEAYYQGQTIIVERAEKPMAVIVPINEFLTWQERKAQLSQIIKDAAARINLSDAKALKLVSEAREKTVKC